MTARICTTVYLDLDQRTALDMLAGETGESMAAIIRRGVDMALTSGVSALPDFSFPAVFRPGEHAEAECARYAVACIALGRYAAAVKWAEAAVTANGRVNG